MLVLVFDISEGSVRNVLGYASRLCFENFMVLVWNFGMTLRLWAK